MADEFEKLVKALESRAEVLGELLTDLEEMQKNLAMVWKLPWTFEGAAKRQ